MTKGHSGETCADAIQMVIEYGEVLRFSELFSRIKGKGEWTDETICQHLMSCVVNLPPARMHWPKVNPFLFLHEEDGRYERYDYSNHGVMRDYWLDPSK
jgi:hypothetical protein